MIAASFALTAAWYAASNRVTVCASIVRGGFGKSAGRVESDRGDSSDRVGAVTVVLSASGWLACCSNGGVTIPLAAKVAVWGGSVVCGSASIWRRRFSPY